MMRAELISAPASWTQCVFSKIVLLASLFQSVLGPMLHRMAANGILLPGADDERATDRRVCIFLSVVVPKVYALIRNLLSPEKPIKRNKRLNDCGRRNH